MAGDQSENPQASEPRYQQIAADLRAAITRGDYKPGHALPTVTTLKDHYGVSRQTVQTALAVLRAEGLTESRFGAGTIVRARPTVLRVSSKRLSRAERQAGRGAMMSDAATGGFTVTSSVSVSFTTADASLAETLGISEGDEVLVRDRVMSADGVRVQLATSWLPRTITRGTQIEQENSGQGGIYARLEDLGYRLARAVESVRARPATAEEAERLQLQLGAPVAEVVRVVFTSEDRPVEVNRMVMAGERYELVYEVPLD
ncbi:GntR family transcriptional regulator [Saccharothrix coeruleofusca]|uniref:GntR family transcriptional regulator n=1 Tax=Saccharothrix coeruleofusca TaxID=33919 RepID=UPI001AEB7669|nr:GntR family transcriptional regulator [Saccharothrix coeruleofusca]MBP2341097.1 GntR family transcriptional regulator [Saccharothrix coeruleofusca]